MSQYFYSDAITRQNSREGVFNHATSFPEIDLLKEQGFLIAYYCHRTEIISYSTYSSPKILTSILLID